MSVDVKTMEVKKTQQSLPVKPANAAAKTKGVIEFLGEVKEEFHKIHWTSKEELLVYTKIVVGATFILGMGVYFMDLSIQGVLSSLDYLVGLLTGSNW